MITRKEISNELNSEEYKSELDKLNRACRDLNALLSYSVLVSNREQYEWESFFFNNVTEDIVQSNVAIMTLVPEGIMRMVRRELRYMLELTLKSCVISQGKNRENLTYYLKNNKVVFNSKINELLSKINFYNLNEEMKIKFIKETQKKYKYLCKYTHSTEKQMYEKYELEKKGRTIGFEGIEELKSIKKDIVEVYSLLVVLIFHSLSPYSVGDYLVNFDGTSNDWFFKGSKYVSYIDSSFDYKFERKEIVEQLIAKRLIDCKF